MRLLLYPLIPAIVLLAACNGGEPSPAPEPRNGTTAPEWPLTSLPEPAAKAPPTSVPAPSILRKKEREPIIADTDSQISRAIPHKGLLPLTRIFNIARRHIVGEIIEVELEDEEGAPYYELEILTDDGRSIEMKIDARRGVVLEIEDD